MELNKKFSNKKKIILGSIIGVLIGTLVSVSYAFYTYTNLGKNNSQLVAGDIYMRYKESSNTININNMSPRSDKPTNDYFEFTVEGKNTYKDKPIVYDINILYGDNETGKERIGDEWLRFTLEEKKDGASEFTEVIKNASYVGFENALRIWKETIPADTTNDIVNTYRLYVWIDNSVGIGNTTEADYSIQRWNNLFASIKVNVTGDFEEKELSKNLYDVVKTGAINDSNIDGNGKAIKFYEINGTDNGNGKFLRSITASDLYPVYYYRGAVEDNNVIFANKCWKIVRTTETGGTKLIYNGDIGNVYKNDNIELNDITFTGVSFNKNENNVYEASFTNDSNSTTAIFSVPIYGSYSLTCNSPGGGPFLVYRGDQFLMSVTGKSVIQLENLSANEQIKITYTAYSIGSSTVDASFSVGNSKLITSSGCNGDNTSIGSSEFNNFDSIANVGYNYGEVYEQEHTNQNKSGTYGNGVSWDGSKYILTNTSSAKDDYHHYICDDTSCTKVRYYYLSNYYIVLQNGDTIETALKKMLSESSDINPSLIKGKIDTWYNTNIKNSYGNFVEDTKWCNDRSVSSANLGGWNPNGGSLSAYMYFDVRNRVENASSSTQPVLSCSNQNDIMTVKNGKLDNPVALLTSDEVFLGGLVYGNANSRNYLVNNHEYWLLSPEISVYASGYLHNLLSVNEVDVRPALSLKPGTQVFGGTGTVSDPYIVGTAN